MNSPAQPATTPRLTLLSVATLILVAFIWGSNFVVVKIGLAQFPPFIFVAMRFMLASLPLIIFLPLPKTPLRWLVLGGSSIGVGQFGLLFYAMRSDISPGMASLLLQTQVFTTVLLAAILFKERVSVTSLLGLTVSALGLLVIIFHVDKTVTAFGLTLALLAAFFWSCGNIAVKCASRDAVEPMQMLAYMAWSSLFAVPPLLVVSWLLEGPAAISAAIVNADWSGWASLLWQTLANTLFGYTVWNSMLSRYPTAVITPFALLVPIFGMGSSALLLHETFADWKLMATALILVGLSLNSLLPAFQRRRSSDRA